MSCRRSLVWGLDLGLKVAALGFRALRVRVRGLESGDSALRIYGSMVLLQLELCKLFQGTVASIQSNAEASNTHLSPLLCVNHREQIVLAIYYA